MRQVIGNEPIQFEKAERLTFVCFNGSVECVRVAFLRRDSGVVELEW